MARPKQKWNIGDLFAVPLPDGTSVLGQIVNREPGLLNSVECAFFSSRMASESAPLNEPKLAELISCLLTTIDLLDSGVWRVIGRGVVVLPKHMFHSERFRSRQGVGAKVIGSRNVTEFLAAYHCLVPWDDWKDPAYLDSLLISPDKRPPNVMLKNAKRDTR